MVDEQFYKDHCPNLNEEQQKDAAKLAANMLGVLRGLPVLQEDVQITRDDLLGIVAAIAAGAGVQAMSVALDAYEESQKKVITAEAALDGIIKQVATVEHYAEMHGLKGNKTPTPSAVHIALGTITHLAEFGLGKRDRVY